MEDPGYRRAVGALRAAGVEVVPLPVDDDGLVVGAVPRGLDAVYCTPAHQFPLGGRLPAARRTALVDRARTEGFTVWEDDYDGELRYDVAPLPLLAALAPDVVVHLGTASKVLTPTLGWGGWSPRPGCATAARAAHRDRPAPRPGRQRVFAALAASGTWPATCAGCGGSWPTAATWSGPRSPPPGTGASATPRGRTWWCRCPTAAPRRRRSRPWWTAASRWARWPSSRWPTRGPVWWSAGPRRRAELVPALAELTAVLAGLRR